MEGMDLVRGVETDLIKSKEIIACTKEFFKEMNQKIAISTMDILKIARKKKRMEICRKILVDVYTRFYKCTTKIDELINVCEYFDALALIDKTLTELDTLPKDINLAAIQDIKRKLKGKRELISEKNSQGISDTISNFNQILYSKCLKTLKVKAGEKSDPRMAGRKQSSRTKILFEMLHKEFEDKIKTEIVSILCHYNSLKKYNLSIVKVNTKDAIKDEAKNISQSEYVPCMKAIYK